MTEMVRGFAMHILKADPYLSSEENIPIKNMYAQLVKYRKIWNYIS